MEMKEFKISELLRFLDSPNTSDAFKTIIVDELKSRGVRFPLLKSSVEKSE